MGRYDHRDRDEVGSPTWLWGEVHGLSLTPPSPFPQNLYDSIRNEPFKIPEDDGNDLTHTFFNPDREGWLLKLGEHSPSSLPCPAVSACLYALLSLCPHPLAVSKHEPSAPQVKGSSPIPTLPLHWPWLGCLGPLPFPSQPCTVRQPGHQGPLWVPQCLVSARKSGPCWWALPTSLLC